MSGGKKKKSTSSSKGKKSNHSSNNTSIQDETAVVESTTLSPSVVDSSTNITTTVSNNNLDVLDRLAPPILFFPPSVSEEYLNRFCPTGFEISNHADKNGLAEEGFPDREIPVMRRLLAMMAGIMSKASAASARAYYSRVAGSEGRRNGYFQQNLNTSVFNLFNTLSAAGNELDSSNAKVSATTNINTNNNASFLAKDGEPLRGYPLRLMKFWRQLSPAEQLRLVKEEHAALTNAWIESRQAWCLCAHCKHRRMTISDLTDCLYQTYCEELESFIASGGQGSTLYSPNLATSTDASAKARRFLFKSLSVVGEQALLPRYNQFIMRLEAFSALAFGNPTNPTKSTNTNSNTSNKKISSSSKACSIQAGLKSAALQASKEFLVKHGIKAPTTFDDNFFDSTDRLLQQPFGDKRDALELASHQRGTDRFEYDIDLNGFDSDEDGNEDDELYSDEEEEERRNQGGIQSEDDDDLIDEETDLPIDESELMLPGGASFPLLPVGDGPVQWSESSRIECGRTVFLMFASEMFQYRLTSAFLAHQTRLRREQLMAEVEAEERLEKEKKARQEKERREKAELEKKKKAAKREKSAAKSASSKKSNNEKKLTEKKSISTKDKENVESECVDGNVVVENIKDDETASISETEIVSESEVVSETVIVSQSAVVSEIIENTDDNSAKPKIIIDSIQPESKLAYDNDEDDFDPNELIEQLSKEMNRFEMNRAVDGDDEEEKIENGPPGFAPPPPGFPAASSNNNNNNNNSINLGLNLNFEPKHLSAVVKDLPPPPPMGFAMPPFSLFNDNNGYTGGYSGGYKQVKANHHDHEHYMYNNHEQAIYNNYDQTHYDHQLCYKQQQSPYYTQSSSHHQQTSSFNPHHNGNPNEYRESPGQSRFQSFFSNSIFGPSSFFSQ